VPQGLPAPVPHGDRLSHCRPGPVPGPALPRAPNRRRVRADIPAAPGLAGSVGRGGHSRGPTGIARVVPGTLRTAAWAECGDRPHPRPLGSGRRPRRGGAAQV